MVRNDELDNKFNIAAAEFAISSYGKCDTMPSTDAEKVYRILSSTTCGCSCCDKAETCDIHKGFDDFKAGIGWMFDMVKGNLAEAFLMEQM